MGDRPRRHDEIKGATVLLTGWSEGRERGLPTRFASNFFRCHSLLQACIKVHAEIHRFPLQKALCR